MADLVFFATDQDRESVWDIVLVEMRLKAVPDPWFGKLPAPTLSTRADVSANLKNYPRVAPGLSYFLTSPDWSSEPLEYHLCKDNPKFAPHWYVSQRYGGASIHFIPSGGYPWHQKPDRIIGGSFSDYPYYYSIARAGEVIERPDGLARTMKALRQQLLAGGKTVRSPTGHRAIAMENALRSYEEGIALRIGDSAYSPISKRGHVKGSS